MAISDERRIELLIAVGLLPPRAARRWVPTVVTVDGNTLPGLGLKVEVARGDPNFRPASDGVVVVGGADGHQR
jgi:hypothetical protein